MYITLTCEHCGYVEDVDSIADVTSLCLACGYDSDDPNWDQLKEIYEYLSNRDPELTIQDCKKIWEIWSDVWCVSWMDIDLLSNNISIKAEFDNAYEYYYRDKH